MTERVTGRVFVTRRIPEAGITALEEAGVDVVVAQNDDECGVERDALIEGTRGSDVLLSLLTERIDREVMEANPNLLGVSNYAVGFDNVDLAVATELGLPVTNTPGVLTDTTADFTWALLMAVSRRVLEAHEYLTAGRYRIWAPNLMLGADVSPGGSGRRKVLGIVGFGRIGRVVARRASGFDMDVLAYDPFSKGDIRSAAGVEWAELDDLLARSDFVTMHTVLTPDTRHMIGEAQLRSMKPTAYLINVSRGAVIDETALVRALREGWIAGAGLDVYEHEPRLTPGLTELPNVVLAPHVASASRDTRDRMAMMAATDALHHLRRQRAIHPVNPEVYDTEAYRRRITR